MAAPISYTEKTLAEFMHQDLGRTAEVLGYAAGIEDAGSYAEAVNETLLAYGVSDISAAVEIPRLRILARAAAWRMAASGLVTAYKFSADGSSYERSALFEHANRMLNRAEYNAAAWEDSRAHVVTVTRSQPLTDPYRYYPYSDEYRQDA